MMLLKNQRRGAEAASKVVDEEWVPIRAGFGEGGGDDARGRMPRRLASRLAPPQVLEVVPEFDRVDRRGEVGELRPPHRQHAFRWLLLSNVLGHPLASAGFGRHGSWGRQRRGGDEREQELEREEEGDGGSKIGEGAGGK